MEMRRFEELARELAARDVGLAAPLGKAREAAERLRSLAYERLEVFKAAAREADAEHLAQLAVGDVEPDEKHIDCIQFRVSRGRWELVCVAKADSKVTLVGPFRRGKPEKPCADHPLQGEEVEDAFEDLLVRLIRTASQR
jgi:hypothetical protein